MHLSRIFPHTSKSVRTNAHTRQNMRAEPALRAPFKSLHLMGEDAEPGDNFHQLPRGTRGAHKTPISPRFTQAAQVRCPSLGRVPPGSRRWEALRAAWAAMPAPSGRVSRSFLATAETLARTSARHPAGGVGAHALEGRRRPGRSCQRSQHS